MNREIPVFFSTDDNYVPFLDVAVASLIENASKDYFYRIIVLNTGLRDENVSLLKRREREGVTIEFADISDRVETVKSYFKNVYHFSVVTYYRLFIASLFPEYDKIIYLDCDLVVTGDVSKLYFTELDDNILGAVADCHVANTPEFRLYAEHAVGVDADTYFNAGVLLISLENFRKYGIEKRFVSLITEHSFDLLDPDQAYLNYLCYGKTVMLPAGWNRVPCGVPTDGEKYIVHYALYKKPWQHADVEDGEYFWAFAETSPFYEAILERKNAFGDEQRSAAESVAREIIAHAEKIIASHDTLAGVLGRAGGTDELRKAGE